MRAGAKRKAWDDLLRIISLCEATEARAGDPFDVDVGTQLERLRSHLALWKKAEELSLDAEAIYRLARVIGLQDGWVKYRCSSLFVDPLLVQLKIRAMDDKELAGVLLRAWHPIARVEQLTYDRLRQGLEYWRAMPTLEGRRRKLPSPVESGELSIEELRELGIISEEGFNDILNALWTELSERAGGGKVEYWDFICVGTYEESLRRAYLMSFLLTYGFASMEMDAVKGEKFLIPLQKPRGLSKAQGVSVPIQFSRSIWEERAGGRS